MAGGQRTAGAEPSAAETRAAPTAEPATEQDPIAPDAGLAPPASREHRAFQDTPGPAAAGTEGIEGVTVSCLTNALYHTSREGFLDTLHRWFMFLVIIAGGVAITDTIPKFAEALGRPIDGQLFRDGCAAAAAILAALDLTFDLSNRARMHSMMKRRYYELLASVKEKKRAPHEARVCLDEFSADEEPAYRVLYLACWNLAQESVYGNARQRYRIGFFSRLFKNWWRRPSSQFRVVPAGQKTWTRALGDWIVRKIG